jgi:hypothetical protein
VNNKKRTVDDGAYFLQISSKQETDFNKHYKALHAPGVPSERDGFCNKPGENFIKVKNLNTGKFAEYVSIRSLYGWIDRKNNVWIPVGQKKGERVPEHWCVEQQDGARTLVFPVKKRRIWRQMQHCVIACNKVSIYSAKDEEAFFEWIKKMSCVERIWSDGDTLYLALATHDLDEGHIVNLHALFRRYKIDLKLLKDFLRKADNPALLKLI